MMCLYPRIMKNKKYLVNKKNGGNPPPVTDERTRYVAWGCGNCMECRKQKARAWQVRLLEDIKTNKNAKFITLTFSDESIMQLNELLMAEIQIGQESLSGYHLDNAIATKGIRLFLERWRKQYRKSLRHWLVTELGHEGTENIHLHGIIWTDEPLITVEQIWQYGFMWKGKYINGKIINYVNARTIGYITKYVNKIDELHKTYKSKILTSPGIGANYTQQQIGDWNKNKYNEQKTIETYRTTTGHKIGLPIYWRNKIYNEEERQKLWVQKLDKQERWILGNKVDISKDEKEYYAGLKHAQAKNKRLGYGSDEQDWTQTQYEKQRRKLMQQTRIKKAEEKKAAPTRSLSRVTPADSNQQSE